MKAVTFKFIPDNIVSYTHHEKDGFGVVKTCRLSYEDEVYYKEYEVWFPDIKQTKLITEDHLLLIKE